MNFQSSRMDEYNLGRKASFRLLLRQHVLAMAARRMPPGKRREEDEGSLNGRRGLALVVNLAGGRRGRARGGASGRGLFGSSKQKEKSLAAPD
jgi:hypothetical protein